MRSIARQYRVTTFGLLWTLLVTLFTLAIYTFLFGVVMKSQWDNGTSSGAPFVLVLFTGLLVFWLMAQSLGNACGSIVQHTNLVKKTVFPLDIIPVTAVGTALFQTLVNTAILLVVCAIFVAHVPRTAILFPVVLARFVLLLTGGSPIKSPGRTRKSMVFHCAPESTTMYDIEEFFGLVPFTPKTHPFMPLLEGRKMIDHGFPTFAKIA